MICEDRIKELKSEVGEEDFSEIVTLFLAESDEMLDRLRAVSGSDELEALLHALKGSALNLGFAELGRLCEDRRERALSPNDWPPDVERIADVYEQSKAQLMSLA
jgi:histidine phosphotransfer protein HptB